MRSRTLAARDFEMAQGFELGLQGFDIHQVFVEQIIVDKRADVGQRAESQSLDDFGGEGVFELTQAVEQVNAIIFQTGEDLGAGSGRQCKIFQMTFESARVKELTWSFEKPVIVKRGVMDDEICHFGVAPIFEGINYRAVGEKGAIGISEFKRNHACRVAAQISLTLGAEFAAHIAGQGALATAERGLVESHIALPTHQGKLNCIQHGRFARAVDANEVGRSLAVDGGVFKEMPVDQADAG